MSNLTAGHMKVMFFALLVLGAASKRLNNHVATDRSFKATSYVTKDAMTGHDEGNSKDSSVTKHDQHGDMPLIGQVPQQQGKDEEDKQKHVWLQIKPVDKEGNAGGPHGTGALLEQASSFPWKKLLLIPLAFCARAASCFEVGNPGDVTFLAGLIKDSSGELRVDIRGTDYHKVDHAVRMFQAEGLEPHQIAYNFEGKTEEAEIKLARIPPHLKTTADFIADSTADSTADKTNAMSDRDETNAMSDRDATNAMSDREETNAMSDRPWWTGLSTWIKEHPELDTEPFVATAEGISLDTYDNPDGWLSKSLERWGLAPDLPAMSWDLHNGWVNTGSVFDDLTGSVLEDLVIQSVRIKPDKHKHWYHDSYIDTEGLFRHMDTNVRKMFQKLASQIDALKKASGEKVKPIVTVYAGYETEEELKERFGVKKQAERFRAMMTVAQCLHGNPKCFFMEIPSVSWKSFSTVSWYGVTFAQPVIEKYETGPNSLTKDHKFRVRISF